MLLGTWDERESGVNDTRFQKVDPDCGALTVRLNPDGSDKKTGPGQIKMTINLIH